MIEQNLKCYHSSDRIYAYNLVIQKLADLRVRIVRSVFFLDFNIFSLQVTNFECIKLVILFALRYERDYSKQVIVLFSSPF
jgi:hypothetical protein